MYKLVILVEDLEDRALFDRGWPEFLRYAEAMPGLRRESTSQVAHVLYGLKPIALIHELFFEDRRAAHEALDSPAGRNAGQTLQAITGGRMTLLLADHLEDSIENIVRARHTRPEPSERTDE